MSDSLKNSSYVHAVSAKINHGQNVFPHAEDNK